MRAVSYIYSLFSQARNFLYSNNLIRAQKFPVPIVSIGNLTSGGTGKTPATIDLARYIMGLGKQPGIVSRGYKRSSHGQVVVADGDRIRSSAAQSGDEPFLITQELGPVPCVVDSNKSNAIRKILNYDVDIVIIDDGFQSRYIDRDLDIVLVNLSQHRKDNGYISSDILLREPLSSLERADIIATSRNGPNRNTQWIKDNTTSPIIEPKEEFSLYISPDAYDIAKDRLIGFSGIGDPRSFHNASSCYGIDEYITLEDHVTYGPQEINMLIASKVRHQAFGFITTRKDYIKLPAEFIDLQNIFVLDYRLQISDSDIVRERVRNILSL